MRVALLLLSTVVALGLLSTAASAREVTPTPVPSPPPLPTSVGPGAVTPPPPPVLPGKGKKGGASKKRGGKRDEATGGGRKGGKAKGGGRKGGGRKGGRDRSSLKPSCGPFQFVQTYSNWGPALSYGRPVTVSYSAQRCSKPSGRALVLAVDGTATVHEVALAGGALIEAKPFSVTGVWRNPGNAEGWPPAWWSCGVSFAEYTWDIAETYTFSVSAREGRWDLNVATQGPAPKTVTWSYTAC